MFENNAFTYIKAKLSAFLTMALQPQRAKAILTKFPFEFK